MPTFTPIVCNISLYNCKEVRLVLEWIEEKKVAAPLFYQSASLVMDDHYWSPHRLSVSQHRALSLSFSLQAQNPLLGHNYIGAMLGARQVSTAQQCPSIAKRRNVQPNKTRPSAPLPQQPPNATPRLMRCGYKYA